MATRSLCGTSHTPLRPRSTKRLKYDVVKDFDHIGRITDVPMTLVAKAGFAAKDVKDVLTAMKSQNATLTYGHAGIGSASHLCMLMLMKEVGVQLKGVAYRGTGPAMNDLLGGQFDLMCDQTTNTTNQIKDGKIKGYAVTTKTKVGSVPDLPPLDAAAIKGFEVSAWHAMWAPKGLPKEATDKLVAALQARLKDAKVIERFASLGTEPVKLDLAVPAALYTRILPPRCRAGALRSRRPASRAIESDAEHWNENLRDRCNSRRRHRQGGDRRRACRCSTCWRSATAASSSRSSISTGARTTTSGTA